MKTLDYNKIEYWKKNKFNFDIGKYFNESIELFSNNWGNFVIYSFIASLLFLISYVTIIGPFIIMFPLLMGFLIGAERVDSKKNLVFNDFSLKLCPAINPEGAPLLHRISELRGCAAIRPGWLRY